MSNQTKATKRSGLSQHKLFWAGLAFVLVIGGLLAINPSANNKSELAYHEVKRGNFLVTIVEGGTLQAVRDVVIRNEVEGTSRIIYIIPEGTVVTNGQLLVELDTGEAEDAVNQQEINYEKAKSGFVLAENDLKIQRSVSQSSIDTAKLNVELAEIDFDKFKQGDKVVDLRAAEVAITTETSKLLLAKDTLDWSQRLYEQGFETKNVVDKERNAVLELQLKVESAETNLWVLKNFTHPKSFRTFESSLEEYKKEYERTIAQSEGKINQLEADLITESNSLVLIKRKLEDDRQQLEKSKIYAPQDGLVVYAIQNSRFSSQTMIEEGAQVRNRQELIKLPDASEMKVEINVHESHVSKVHPGQAAFVTLDPMPDLRFKAEVSKVAVLPDAQSRFGNPNLKVYKTEVIIKETMNDIKPGVSARAEIVITNIPSTITVPIQAITTLKGKTVAFVRQGSESVPVQVAVGMFNTKSIEIRSGLDEGDLILLSPPFDAEEKDLGGSIIGEDDEIPPPNPNPVPPNGTGPSELRKQGPGPGPGRGSPGDPSTTSTRGGGPDGPSNQQSGSRPRFNREEMMKRFDKNGDGKIDDTERETMRASLGGSRGGGGGGGGPGRSRSPGGDGNERGGRDRGASRQP